MNTTSDLSAIRELNMSYLALAQRILASDREAAQSHLGLSVDTADMLLKLSPEQTLKLASSSQVLCFFRMSTDAMLAGLAGRSHDVVASPVANDVLMAA